MLEYRIIESYSHWTFSEAAPEVIVSTLLFAWHRYWWLLSVLFTFLNVSCLLSGPKLTLGWILMFTVDPSMVQEMVGFGFPVAWQDRVTLSPSRTVWLRGWVVKAGLSEKGKKSTVFSLEYVSWERVPFTSRMLSVLRDDIYTIVGFLL